MTRAGARKGTRARRLVGKLPDGDPRGHITIDDEPTTAEDRSSARNGQEAYKRGDYATADELKRE